MSPVPFNPAVRVKFFPNRKPKPEVADVGPDGAVAVDAEDVDEPYYWLGYLTSLDRLEIATYFENEKAAAAAAAAKSATDGTALEEAPEEAPSEEERIDEGQKQIRAGWEMARRALRGWGNVGNGPDGKPLKFLVERGQKYASRDSMHSIPQIGRAHV